MSSENEKPQRHTIIVGRPISAREDLQAQERREGQRCQFCCHDHRAARGP